MNIDFNLILEFVLRILLILFVSLVIPKLQTYLNKKIGEKDTEALIGLIYELVRASEQLLYGKDEDGTLRKKYVMEQLAGLGYEWDNKINAYVESAVYDLNQSKAIELEDIPIAEQMFKEGDSKEIDPFMIKLP